MPSIFTNQTYLKTEQYRNADNLNARITIHQRFSTNPQGWFAWVWDVLDTLPRQARVLELGCGAGSLWSDRPERIPAGWQITLSDLSDGMLAAAWRNLIVLHRGFKFEQIDAQAIPYPGESFDIVIANHMLYHVPDRPKALAGIRRVLKPGGTLIATTVGRNHLHELNAWIKRVHLDKDFEPFVNPFVLENGLEQLQPFFSKIDMKRYDDNLRITEIEPLMAYIRSSWKATVLSENGLQTLEQELTHQLERDGALYVTKVSGLFEAVK